MVSLCVSVCFNQIVTIYLLWTDFLHSLTPLHNEACLYSIRTCYQDITAGQRAPKRKENSKKCRGTTKGFILLFSKLVVNLHNLIMFSYDLLTARFRSGPFFSKHF